MKCVSLHLHSAANIDELSKELECLGCHIIYSEEEGAFKTIFANVTDDFDQELKHPHIKAILPYQLPEINWVEQYENHGLNYFEGLVHADLREFGCQKPLYNPIIIRPGPGFGDLSHPTTTLTLKLMSGHMHNQNVLDMGSGSGILSFAALSMGARSVFGIDIDEAALTHSRVNSQLNNMEKKVIFDVPKNYQPPKSGELTLLMNMIQQEQMEAWNALTSIHHLRGDCFTSGILETGKKEYLEWTKSLGWTLHSTLGENGWLSFHFTR